ncbi:MAG: cupin domain-containing protein [Alphaproteobacteria bacterium]
MTHGVKTSATPGVELYSLAADGPIPNNSLLPLVVYRAALPCAGGDPASACEAIFARNKWGNGWRNGVYPYHHYHSTAHEVLGIVRGEARVRFGGDHGPVVVVRAGDVVVIPAGVAHKAEGASRDLLIVGAYPEGQKPDLCTEKDSGPATFARIADVPRPVRDPVHGDHGPILDDWPRD